VTSERKNVAGRSLDFTSELDYKLDSPSQRKANAAAIPKGLVSLRAHQEKE